MKYARKSEWARAKAEDLRTLANTLRHQSSLGSYARAARKGEQVANLTREAQRFDAMARSFEAKGL